MLCQTSSQNLQTSLVFTDRILLISNDSDSYSKIGVIDSDACIIQKNYVAASGSYSFSYYSDSNLLINDFETGIVDAMIISEYEALPTPGMADYPTKVLSESPIYFVVLSENQAFYSELNATLQQMANDGTIDRLKQEYINSLN